MKTLLLMGRQRFMKREIKPIRTEEGMLVIADNTFEQLNVDEYDSLLITGAADAQGMVEDESTQEFVSKFYDAGTLIGAISIAPILLLKLGYLKEKPFMIGVEKSNLYEEGFTDDDMKYMIGWEESCDEVVPEKYLKTDNIITSVAFGFRQWAMAIGKELNIELYPKSFDL
ncbi:DJ-1/PfpI family protein [Paenibacillus thiaminolyticus]|uniref:DJ-1/PfpI family protein n=1 Tax=Paenibacillus thiaminolyticus TaxID=49283 RepID=UPI00232AA30F|nr:DJ-1/PfpI family protein [Paenibacillus thiaminolyticus]WCF06881.1 DJ-1/PfpI family protein [Paenibacillus thiaminolyticus]